MTVKRTIMCMRIVSSLLLLLFVTLAMGQKSVNGVKKDRTISLWGHVRNSFTKVGIPDVKITLMREDSTVVDSMRVWTNKYNATKIDASYRFTIPAREGKYIILARHPDYYDCYVDYTVKTIVRNTYFDAPWHDMRRRDPGKDLDLMLDEVEVKATKVKIAYKGDTVIFNADAFNVPDGSMLDALIKQLPGVELKSNGEIYVNGRKVDYLTLNGKDFFKGNNKVMLENLPHYTVKDIRVYDKSTEKSEWLGRDVEQKEYVMDVKLKKEYSHGWLGNADMEGGTNDRYMLRGFGMRFTDNSRLVLFGNMNNLNQCGTPQNDSDWGQSSGFQGDMESKYVGGKLMVDDKDKRFLEEATFQLWGRETDIRRLTARENFLPSGNVFSRAASFSESDIVNLRANNKFTLKKPFRLVTLQRVEYNDYKDNAFSRDATFNADPSEFGDVGQVLDSLYGGRSLVSSLDGITTVRQKMMNSAKSSGLQLGTENTLTFKLPTGDNWEFAFSGSYNHTSYRQFYQSRYEYMRTEQDVDDRNSFVNKPSRSYNYTARTEYMISWLNKWNLATYYIYDQNYEDETNGLHRLDRLGGWATDGEHIFGELPSTRDSLLLALDASNSYAYNTLGRVHRIGIRPYYNRQWDDKSLWFNVHIPASFISRRMNYHSAQIDTCVRVNYTFIRPDMTLIYHTHNYARRYYLSCSLAKDEPDMRSLIDFRDDADPLHVRLGNPDLKPSTTYNFTVGYLITKREIDQYISLSANGNIKRNLTAQGYTYNKETGAYTYRPENVNGNWSANASCAYGRALDKQKKWHLWANVNTVYTRSVDLSAEEGMSESRISKVGTMLCSEGVTMQYQHEGLSVTAHLTANWWNSRSRREGFETINAFNFQYGGEVAYELPFNIKLSTEACMYSRRGYSEKAMNTNEFVWNATVSRKLFNGRMHLFLTAVDILGRLSNTSYNVDAQGHTETWVNTLPRYVMLRLQYKFGMKKK